MLVAPARQRIVDVDQLFGKLVQLEPAVGIAIDLKPGRGERLDRAVADVEPGALERGDRRIAQARPLERRLRARAALRGALVIMFEIGRILEPEPDIRSRGTAPTGSPSWCRARRGT